MQKSVNCITDETCFLKKHSIIKDEILDENINTDKEMGLVGYWGLNEGTGNTAHDTSGYNNHGNIHGAKWNDEGISSYSLKFDGNWDYVTVDDGDVLNFDDTNAFTLSVWIKWDGGTSPRNQGIIQNMFLNKGYKLTLDIEERVHFRIGDGTTCYDCRHEIQPNQWYYITAVWDGNDQCLFIDGELVNQSLNENFQIAREIFKYLEFGNNWGYTDNLNTFNGLIDEIRIYERALTNSEIKELYHQGRPEKLIGYWNFDDNNDICHDYSGNENHGINYGATWTTDSAVGEGALIFDGIDDYMDIPDTTDFGFRDQSITFTCWTQIVDNTDENRRFISLKSKTSGYPSVSLVKCRSGFNDGRIVFSIHDNDNEITMASSIYNGNQLPKNTWLFITGVIEYPNTVKLYINDELQESVQAISYDMTDYEDISLNFGKSATSPDMHKGMLDEIRIYARALTEDEIIDLYNEGAKPPKADFTFTPRNPSIDETVIFTDLSTDDGGITSWWWDFGDGYYSDIKHPSHNYYSSGGYIINLTVMDNDGLTSSIAKKIEVN